MSAVGVRCSRRWSLVRLAAWRDGGREAGRARSLPTGSGPREPGLLPGHRHLWKAGLGGVGRSLRGRHRPGSVAAVVEARPDASPGSALTPLTQEGARGVPACFGTRGACVTSGWRSRGHLWVRGAAASGSWFGPSSPLTLRRPSPGAAQPSRRWPRGYSRTGPLSAGLVALAGPAVATRLVASPRPGWARGLAVREPSPSPQGRWAPPHPRWGRGRRCLCPHVLVRARGPRVRALRQVPGCSGPAGDRHVDTHTSQGQQEMEGQ